MPDHDTRGQEGDPPDTSVHDEMNVEGSIIGWALRNAKRVSALRERLNSMSPPENRYSDNEELIVHLLEDVIEVYEQLKREDLDPAHMFENGEYEV
jgi:hypothetical protein